MHSSLVRVVDAVGWPPIKLFARATAYIAVAIAITGVMVAEAIEEARRD